MKQGTITAKIGYGFYVPVDKERMAQMKALSETDEAGFAALFEGIPLLKCASGAQHPIVADLNTAEGFLYGGGLTFPCHRWLWPEVDFALPGFRPYDGHLLLTMYHDSNVCQVSVNFTVQTGSVEDLVYLRQIFQSPLAVTPDGTSISGMAERLLAPFGATAAGADPAYTLEINDFFGMEPLETILEEQARSIYGMMTGDEGFAFVPEALAKQRIENRWGSRDFFTAIAFRNNFLLFNLVQGDRAEAYRYHQGNFGSARYGGPNGYFFMDAKTPGVNHGMFFSVEMGMVAKTVCDGVLEHQSHMSHESHRKVREAIRTTKELRRDLIVTLNRLERIGMAELDEMSHLIMAGLEIDPMVEKIKYLLELLESELDLLYQTSTNTLVNILTVVGLLLSAVQVIMCFA